MLINILKQRYSRQHVTSSSAVSTPMMVNKRERKRNIKSINYTNNNCIFFLNSHEIQIHPINVHHRLILMMKIYRREILMVRFNKEENRNQLIRHLLCQVLLVVNVYVQVSHLLLNQLQIQQNLILSVEYLFIVQLKQKLIDRYLLLLKVSAF